jgi:hypothetical protein
MLMSSIFLVLLVEWHTQNCWDETLLRSSELMITVFEDQIVASAEFGRFLLRKRAQSCWQSELGVAPSHQDVDANSKYFVA